MIWTSSSNNENKRYTMEKKYQKRQQQILCEIVNCECNTISHKWEHLPQTCTICKRNPKLFSIQVSFVCVFLCVAYTLFGSSHSSAGFILINNMKMRNEATDMFVGQTNNFLQPSILQRMENKLWINICEDRAKASS